MINLDSRMCPIVGMESLKVMKFIMVMTKLFRRVHMMTFTRKFGGKHTVIAGHIVQLEGVNFFLYIGTLVKFSRG